MVETTGLAATVRSPPDTADPTLRLLVKTPDAAVTEPEAVTEPFATWNILAPPTERETP